MPTIPVYRTSVDDIPQLIRQLHARLSVRGDVVTAAGRQKTIEVFGQPLTAAEVVDRICTDVQRDGISAVLDYTAKLDGVQLTPAQLRVDAQELQAAHQRADARFLATVRRIRDNIRAFQAQLLPQTSTLR